jgi:hypothetical protein
MKSELISMTHTEYIEVYRTYRDILNPERFSIWGTTYTNSAHMAWEKIGLEYYDTTSEGKKFKVLNQKKWQHHLMMMKLMNG